MHGMVIIDMQEPAEELPPRAGALLMLWSAKWWLPRRRLVIYCWGHVTEACAQCTGTAGAAAHSVSEQNCSRCEQNVTLHGSHCEGPVHEIWLTLEFVKSLSS